MIFVLKIKVMVASFFDSEKEASERIIKVSVSPTKYGEDMIKKAFFHQLF